MEDISRAHWGLTGVHGGTWGHMGGTRGHMGDTQAHKDIQAGHWRHRTTVKLLL